jgi:hypothetical protein
MGFTPVGDTIHHFQSNLIPVLDGQIIHEIEQCVKVNFTNPGAGPE